jgi:chromosome partitioning protein
MNRIVVSNQRGGVSKTTTAATLAREFADRGKRVLLIDTDPQGSVASILGLQPKKYLYNFIIEGLKFEDCVVPISDQIHVMCSNRETVKAEAILMGNLARERAFSNLFQPVEHTYDVVLVDVSPSINLLQTCALVYAEQILIPVAMDTLSFQGATASIETAKSINELLKTHIRTIGILPVMVDNRLAMTKMVLEGLDGLSKKTSIPLLPVIRTDQTVTKAARARQFLADYDPKCKALEDYRHAADSLISILEKVPENVRAAEVSA